MIHQRIFLYTSIKLHLTSMRSIDIDALQARRDLFIARGETVADWAKLHGFEAQLVYAVLSGRLAARRGQAHRIAIALGLKPAPHHTTSQPEPQDCAPIAQGGVMTK